MSEEQLLQEMRRRWWTDEEWQTVVRFEGDENRYSEQVLSRIFIEHGEDLPGSWHQQSNGGTRRWATVHGEWDSQLTRAGR